MKNPLSKPKLLPAEFYGGKPLFILVYRQTPEDYVALRRVIFKRMRPLELLSNRYFPWINLIALPWLWSQFQTKGWTWQTLRDSFLPLLMLLALAYFLWEQWRGKRAFVRGTQIYPYRALIVFDFGCAIFASDEKGNLSTPQRWLYHTFWKDIAHFDNASERAILISKKHYGVLISNKISACSCDVAQASRILNELLARPVQQFAPIAEPH